MYVQCAQRLQVTDTRSDGRIVCSGAKNIQWQVVNVGAKFPGDTTGERCLLLAEETHPVTV
jgi:hypothetical protein